MLDLEISSPDLETVSLKNHSWARKITECAVLLAKESEGAV